MADQTYQNHRHMPVATNLAFLFWMIAVVATARMPWFGLNTETIGAGAALAAIGTLISISRLYVTRLQDRIILLEMKVRCAEVLPAGDDAKLAKLRKAQIVALRFASDHELGALVDRAIAEDLSATDIKKAIQHWKADTLRT